MIIINFNKLKSLKINKQIKATTNKFALFILVCVCVFILGAYKKKRIELFILTNNNKFDKNAHASLSRSLKIIYIFSKTIKKRAYLIDFIIIIATTTKNLFRDLILDQYRINYRN